MSYTENQFNQAMAELAGIPHRVVNGRVFVDGPFDSSDEYMAFSDLNIIIPLAWKCGIDLDQELDKSWSAKAYLSESDIMHGVHDIVRDDPIQAVRDCLWLIAQERKV